VKVDASVPSKILISLMMVLLKPKCFGEWMIKIKCISIYLIPVFG
jgi:hypothetical protein